VSSDPTPPASRVAVRRSGGFAGLTTEREIDLAADPAGAEVAELLGRIDLTRLPKTPPQPDRYVYTIRTGDHEMRVNEQDLTPELARLVDIVLRHGGDR
jgi:hypothetical protein